MPTKPKGEQEPEIIDLSKEDGQFRLKRESWPSPPAWPFWRIVILILIATAIRLYFWGPFTY